MSSAESVEPAEEQVPVVVQSEEHSSVPQSDDASVPQTEDHGANDAEAAQNHADNTTEPAPKAKPPTPARHDTTLTPGLRFDLQFWVCELCSQYASCRKIFIGGIGPEIVEADLKEYFGGMGEITDVVVMKGAPRHVIASADTAQLFDLGFFETYATHAILNHW